MIKLDFAQQDFRILFKEVPKAQAQLLKLIKQGLTGIVVRKNILGDLLHNLRIQLQDKIFAIIKVKVNRSRRHARLIGYLFNGKAVKTLVGKQVQCGLQNSFAFIHRKSDVLKLMVTTFAVNESSFR